MISLGARTHELELRPANLSIKDVTKLDPGPQEETKRSSFVTPLCDIGYTCCPLIVGTMSTYVDPGCTERATGSLLLLRRPSSKDLTPPYMSCSTVDCKGSYAK